MLESTNDLARRCESLILDEVTDLIGHGSLPVGRYMAPSLGGDSEKPAGQTGSSGNPGGDHAVLFWQYYVENSKAVCCDAIRRNGGPVVVLLGYAHLCRF